MGSAVIAYPCISKLSSGSAEGFVCPGQELGCEALVNPLLLGLLEEGTHSRSQGGAAQHSLTGAAPQEAKVQLFKALFSLCPPLNVPTRRLS